jgi:threonyl-tRNA synthetase
MIHRALMGASSASSASSIEHYAGEFRCGSRRCRRWCCRSPTVHIDYAKEVVRTLADAGIGARSTTRRVDRQEDPRGRAAKAPYMLVVGDNELEKGEVAVRRHREGDKASSRHRADFVAAILARGYTARE